jgi:hypothetical protein
VQKFEQFLYTLGLTRTMMSRLARMGIQITTNNDKSRGMGTIVSSNSGRWGKGRHFRSNSQRIAVAVFNCLKYFQARTIDNGLEFRL